jgi:hypothetical protein
VKNNDIAREEMRNKEGQQSMTGLVRKNSRYGCLMTISMIRAEKQPKSNLKASGRVAKGGTKSSPSWCGVGMARNGPLNSCRKKK